MNTSESALARWGRRLLALVLGLFGLFMVVGGVWLIGLGGNWYYAIAGLLSIASAVSLARRRPSATLWFGLLFALTLVWTIVESGADYWGWVPRFALMLIFAIAFSVLLPTLHAGLSRGVARVVPLVLVAGFVVYPAFYAIYLSMLNKKMTAFVGLGNFAFLLKRNTFQLVIFQSCLFAVTAVVFKALRQFDAPQQRVR